MRSRCRWPGPAFAILTGLGAVIILVLVGGAVMAAESEWTFTKFPSRKLLEWEFTGANGEIVGELGLERLLLTAEKEHFSAERRVRRIWTGYSGVTVDARSGEKAVSLQVVITDWDYEQWASPMYKLSDRRSRQRIPFSRFEKREGDGDELLGLADVKSIRLEFSGSKGQEPAVEIYSLSLFGSKGWLGPSVTISPELKFYDDKKDLGWAGIAREIKDKGFTRVNVVTVRQTRTNWQDIIDACHAEGLTVFAGVWPTIWFEAYAARPEWRQRMLGGGSTFSWCRYICPLKPEAGKWVRDRVEQIFSQYDFDGMEILEAWWEVEGGPYRDNQNRHAYACLCDEHIRQYLEKYPEDPHPLREMFNTKSKHYFEDHLGEDDPYFAHWVPWRQDTLYDVCKIVVDAVREAKPEAKIVAMHLGDVSQEYNRNEEYIGQQLEKAISRLQPDGIQVESAWQDWGYSAELTRQLGYNDAYPPRVRKADPDVKVTFYTDIGSNSSRSYRWMQDLTHYARYLEKPESGFDVVQFYEYSLGKYIDLFHPYINDVYTFTAGGLQYVRIVFNKAHDGGAALDPANYQIVGLNGEIDITGVSTDYSTENTVVLTVSGLEAGQDYALYVSGVSPADVPFSLTWDGSPYLDDGYATFTADFNPQVRTAVFHSGRDNTVILKFNVRPEGKEWLDPGSYRVDSGARAIRAFRMGSASIALQLENVKPGKLYTISYPPHGNDDTCYVEAPLF